jgi:hypothetical protein
VPEHSDEVPVLEVADDETPPLAGTIKATRPRRRVEVAVTSSSNGVEDGGSDETEMPANVPRPTADAPATSESVYDSAAS